MQHGVSKKPGSIIINIHHAGYFLVGWKGGGGGTGVFPPFRLAVIIVYYIFQKILHPQDPPTTGSHANIPPFKISLENILPVIDLSKTLQKAYQAKALSKRSRMTFVSAS